MTNPPHTIQEVVDLLLKEFDLLWGIAPPDSLKGKKGADIKAFLRSQIHKIAAQTLSAVVPEERALPANVLSNDVPLEWQNIKGFNSCRQEVLRRGKEFLNEV